MTSVQQPMAKYTQPIIRSFFAYLYKLVVQCYVQVEDSSILHVRVYALTCLLIGHSARYIYNT